MDWSGAPALETLSGVFSSAVFRELSREHPASFALERVAAITDCVRDRTTTLGEVFDRALDLMLRYYRNEYVYKNGLVSKVIFGRHSPRTASAILELRMGNSWADVVVVNGTTTTYEIKTDLDQFARLGTQLTDYQSRSEFVVVVTSENRAVNAERVLPSHVGIIALRKSGALSNVRPAESNLARMTPGHLFSMLRTSEAISILREMRGYEVDAPSGEIWKQTRMLFSELTVEEAHRGTLSQLRLRGKAAAELASTPSFPRSLRALAYRTELTAVGRRRLLQKLSAPATLVRES